MSTRRIRARAFGVALATLIAATTLQIGAAPSATAAPLPPSLHPVNPTRLMDTRPGFNTDDGISAGIGRLKARSVTPVLVAGRAGVPLNATAVVVNVAAMFPDDATAVTVFPCDINRPNASNLNSPPGDIRANGAFVKLSSDGELCVYTTAATDILIDINGYVPRGGAPFSLSPARLLDTRPGQATVDGTAAGIGRRGANSTYELKVAGRGGVASDARAALLNITADIPGAGTAITVYPCNQRPTASNLNVPIFDTRANNAFVKLSSRGTVCIHTVAPTDIIVDVNGYVPAGAVPLSVNPARLLDTRPGQSTVDGVAAGTGRVRGGFTTVVQVSGRGGVPAGATAAYVNVTSILPSAGTYLKVFPCDGGPSMSSTVNSPPHDIRANTVFVQLSKTGTVCIFNISETDIVVDVNGYVPAPPVQRCTINGKTVSTQIPPSECAALTALYNATDGKHWNHQAGWMSGTDPCTWYGIKCDDGHVATINLEYSNLSGAVPSAIGNLSRLTSLNLGGNQLTSVPTTIGKLTDLLDLRLGSNQILNIPREIGNLVWLDYLDLSINALASLPAEITQLRRLTLLYVHYNQLTSLPTSIGDLSNLRSLIAGNNQLTLLPASLGRLTNLVVLNARDNQLSGDITAVILPLKNAKVLSVVSLRGNKCLTTRDAALAAWLNVRDPGWKDGC